MAVLSTPPPLYQDPAFPDTSQGQLLAGLYSTLNDMSINNNDGSSGDWFLDMSATAHMAPNSGILSSPPSNTYHRHIVVGNSQFLPTQCYGHASISTPSSSPLQLRNVLIAPQIVKNLILVHALTRDNVVSVEFDLWGFSIKDLRTKMALLRCDSLGDLYPI
jgi:hypothetical protein